MVLVEQAEALVRNRRTSAAVALLEQATSAGDADAAFHLAVWYLVGKVVPRDVAKTRRLLTITAPYHVDAALMAMALMANGSGGETDWAGALALLQLWAPLNDEARSRLALIDAMDLDAQGNPAHVPQGEMIGTAPEVYLVRDFLSTAECKHIARSVSDLMEPAHVVDPRTGRMVAHPVRTSAGAVIGPTREDLPIAAINRRIARLSGTDLDRGEPLAVLHYSPGQQYRPHHDSLPGVANQRSHTVLLYLNDAYRGGETHFLGNGLRVAGRAGDAIMFRNTDDAGRPDPRSQHAGLPITHGTKWLATRWIRAGRHDIWSG